MLRVACRGGFRRALGDDGAAVLSGQVYPGYPIPSAAAVEPPRVEPEGHVLPSGEGAP